MTAIDSTDRRARPDVPLRVGRLADAAAARYVDPDRDLPGSLGPGQPFADEMLSTVGLDLDLTPEQKRRLARAELGSMLDTGIRFEAVLIAGFALHIAHQDRLADPRVRFLLHELGEETRHQRAFLRVLDDLGEDAGRLGTLESGPRPGSLRARLLLSALRPLRNALVMALVSRPALFHVAVLAGEEVPDLVQKRQVEHPDTDPFLREVSRYHRMEEARHIGYAKAVFPEVWAAATPSDRFAVRHVAPRLVAAVFAFFVRPSVYAAAGLPTWETWRRVNATPERLRLRAEAARPLLDLLLSAGALRRGRVPRRWRELCQVDRHGAPLPGA